MAANSSASIAGHASVGKPGDLTPQCRISGDRRIEPPGQRGP